MSVRHVLADLEPEKCQMISCLILSTKLQIVGGGISEWADVNKINEDTALLFAWYYNNQSELILKMLIYMLHTFFFFFKVKWPWYVGSTEWLVDLLGWFFKITHLVFTLKPQNEREKETKKNLQFFLGFRKLLLDFNIVQKLFLKRKFTAILLYFLF